MNVPLFQRRRGWILALALVPSLTPPSTASAQTQFRVQAAATDAWSGDYHALMGVDLAVDLGGRDCRPGGLPCEVPNWTLLLAGYAGIVTDSTPFSAYGHVGAERKLTDQLSLGVVGFAFANPGQKGAALRIDAMDVAAFKVGYGWGNGEGMLVSMEIALGFLQDLGR